jgi:hypothetical protein
MIRTAARFLTALGRSLTRSSAGIRSGDVAGSVVAQLAGMLLAVPVVEWLREPEPAPDS